MITCAFEDQHPANLRHVCVDALIVNGEKVLLSKRTSTLEKAPGKYCLPGGYLARDEYLVDGVKREAREETGYSLTGGELFQIRDTPADLPDTDRQDIVFVYLFEGVESTPATEPDWESEETSWIPLTGVDQLRHMIAFDHYAVIQAFMEYRKGALVLPIMSAFDIVR